MPASQTDALTDQINERFKTGEKQLLVRGRAVQTKSLPSVSK